LFLSGEDFQTGKQISEWTEDFADSRRFIGEDPWLQVLSIEGTPA
jgi:hypothetical protein